MKDALICIQLIDPLLQMSFVHSVIDSTKVVVIYKTLYSCVLAACSGLICAYDCVCERESVCVCVCECPEAGRVCLCVIMEG